MVIFRENTEDIYVGIEFEADSEDNRKFQELFKQAFPKQYSKIRFPETSGIGIKPVSREGTERLVRAAIDYAIAEKRKSMTLVHKGNIMKFTEGAFRNWGYALAENEFGAASTPGNSGSAPRPTRARRPRTRSRTRRTAPARSSSRTRSPTSRCSRCSRGRTSSTSSPR